VLVHRTPREAKAWVIKSSEEFRKVFRCNQPSISQGCRHIKPQTFRGHDLDRLGSHDVIRIILEITFRNSDYLNACDHNPPTLQTNGCNREAWCVCRRHTTIPALSP